MQQRSECLCFVEGVLIRRNLSGRRAGGWVRRGLGVWNNLDHTAMSGSAVSLALRASSLYLMPSNAGLVLGVTENPLGIMDSA